MFDNPQKTHDLMFEEMRKDAQNDWKTTQLKTDLKPHHVFTELSQLPY